MPPRRINEIVHGKRGISADTALRLARYFGTSERFWLDLQAQDDLDVERDRLGERLNAEVTPHAQGGHRPRRRPPLAPPLQAGQNIDL